MKCVFCEEGVEAFTQGGGESKTSFARCRTCGDYDVSPDVIARVASDLYLKQRLALQVKDATHKGKILVAAVDALRGGVTITHRDSAVERSEQPPPESTSHTHPPKSKR